MDFAINFLISVLANISTDSAKFLISKLKAAKNPAEKCAAISSAKSTIELDAANGRIILEDAALEALKSIQCNHAEGIVQINQSLLKASKIVTGGFSGSSSGSTKITQSELKSDGTKISVNSGGSVSITGNASIKQS